MSGEIREFDTLPHLLADLKAEGITGIDRKNAVDRFIRLRARKNAVPYAGSFELTPFCNLDCKMCYVHLSKEQVGDQKLLTTEQWIDIANQAIDAGLMNVDLTGGECLTYPGFREVYDHLQNRGIRTAILTNGILLTEEMVQFLSRRPPVSVQVTVYGSNPEAYRKVTGHDAFDAVMAGIDRLKAAGIRTNLALSPSRYMQDDAIQLLELIRSKELAYAIGGVTLPARIETGRDMAEYAADIATRVELLKNDRDYRNKRYPAKEDGKKAYQFTLKGLSLDKGVPCDSGMCSFHINWKGEMTPCIPFMEPNISVLDGGFAEAWKRVNCEASAYSEPAECAQCKHRKTCTSCPAEKRFGKLDGALNRHVCHRLETYLAEKVVYDMDSEDC